jgi:soluble lytic murein transglycosylase-like protein
MPLRSLVLCCTLVSASLSAATLGHIVTLHDGQRIRVDKADRDGDQVFLTAATGVTILSASDVRSIEAEPDPSKPPPVAVAAKPSGKPDTQALIRAAAKAHGLPVGIVQSIAEVESGLKTNAVSHKGAIGVMQLMPGTARELGVDPNDVAQNIDGGTRLLRNLLIKYENDPDQIRKALAAYNAGPGAVARYQGVPPYKETQDYVRKVVRKLQNVPLE